jgi:hypothetical protein
MCSASERKDEIPEITPEMIKAGQDCLDDLFERACSDLEPEGLWAIPPDWAEPVYLAMYRKRNPPRAD